MSAVTTPTLGPRRARAAALRSVRLAGDMIVVDHLELDGTLTRLAEEIEATDPEGLEHLLRDVIEVGATVLLHGRSKATIDAVSTEVDRLLAETSTMTEGMPAVMRDELAGHVRQLQEILAKHFDPGSTTSVQAQLAASVRGVASEEVGTLRRDLVADDGPLATANSRVAAQLTLMGTTTQEVVTKLSSLIEKIEMKLALDDARERSTQKGQPFEDVVLAELEAIHGPLGDQVLYTAKTAGVVPGSEAGDFVVVLNPKETRGVEIRIAIDAKTGRLSGPKAQEALDETVANREAQGGILVFDSAADAPMGGRNFCPYADNRFIAVFDAEQRDPLALEVACRQARTVALAALTTSSALDSAWLGEQCELLIGIVESARDVKLGSAAAKRGLIKVDAAYERLRDDALAVISAIQEQLDGRGGQA